MCHVSGTERNIAEAFKSANCLLVLDPAALRRFDLKLKFDYLTPQQRLDFAKQQAEKLNLGAWDETHSKRMLELNLLTLGDFAAVARRHNFSPFENLEEWLDALRGECLVKPEFSRKKVGF